MKNDITKPTGFLLTYKRDIEPRILELAELRGKLVRIEVTVPDTIDNQDWEYVPNTQNGKTVMAAF